MAMGSVGIAPGVTTMRMPDGTVIAVADFVDREMWSTCDITAQGGHHPLELLSYGRSQQVTGSTRCATSADTSFYRAGGGSGLPQAHEFIVMGWRVALLAPRRVLECDALTAWQATTVMEFRYRGSLKAADPLSELTRCVSLPDDGDPITFKDGAPSRPMRGQTFALPIRLQENLSFQATLTPQNAQTVDALRLTLACAGVDLSVRVFFHGRYKNPVF